MPRPEQHPPHGARGRPRRGRGPRVGGAPAPGRIDVRLVPDPAAARALAASARERLAQLPPGAEPVPLERLGLVLVHLGERHPGGLADLVESVHRAAAGVAPFELVLDRLGTRPPGEGARTLSAWPSAGAPGALAELARRLAARLVSPERRSRGPFEPALTLVRWRPARAAAVEGPLAPVALAVREVVVASARETSGGSALVELARVPLGG